MRQVRIIIKNAVENETSKMPTPLGQNGTMDFDIIKSNLGENISKFVVTERLVLEPYLEQVR